VATGRLKKRDRQMEQERKAKEIRSEREETGGKGNLQAGERDVYTVGPTSATQTSPGRQKLLP